VSEEYIEGVIEGEGFKVPQFVNKGIVINIEDFGGRIEIIDSTFEKNMHYIPGIEYRPQS